MAADAEAGKWMAESATVPFRDEEVETSSRVVTPSTPAEPRPRTSPALVPCLIGATAAVLLAASEGGFEPVDWYLAAVLILVLVAVCAFSLPWPRPGRAALTAAGLLLAYAAWSWLSVTWADDQGTAVAGANRTLLYALVFALFALWPLRAVPAVALAAALALGVAAVGLIELVRVGASDAPIEFFFRGRLSEPVGYANANVALWSAGMWPAIVLAGRRELHPLLRGAFLGSAGLLAGLALLGQSRGWLFALPLVALVAVLVTPGRGRVVGAMAAVLGGGLVMAGPVLKVHQNAQTLDLSTTFPPAQRMILAVAGALTVIGVIAALLDRRLELPAHKARRASVATVAAAALACALVVGAYAVSQGSPLQKVSDSWADFKQGGSSAEGEGGSRLTGDLATNRYDFWRVAWASFESRPLVGVGADNFQQDYLERGESAEAPRYPHSLELRVLSQTGLIGALLLLGAIAAAMLAVAPVLRSREPGLAGAAAAAGVVAFAYFVAHGSVDWLWEFAGLGVLAFASLGIAVSAAQTALASNRNVAAPRRGRTSLALVALATAVAALALVPAALSERSQRQALDGWPAAPAGAFAQLDRARALNPWTSTPDVIAGSIAVAIGEREKAAAEFADALERDPRNSFALLMLGAVESEAGHRAAARRLLERALAAAPRSEPARKAVRAAQRGRRLDASAIAADLSSATRRRVARDFQD